MAETLLSVRTEVLARGFDYLSTTRANRIVNDAYSWLVGQYRWPFREATATGAAPLTISDLAIVGSVKDTANSNRRLKWVDRRTIEERYGDLAVAGTPRWWYFEGSVIKTYPVGGTLSVRYWRNATALSADADTLIVPDKWVQIIVDRACYRAYLDSDNAEMVRLVKQEVADALLDMATDLLQTQVADEDQVVVYGGEDSR